CRVKLSEALASFIAQIRNDSVYCQGSRRVAAVIVVGDGTRLLPEDISALRQLAFIGKLWIVSNSVQILSFLAQRINRRTGIEYRSYRHCWADTIRDTITTAAGGQEIICRSLSRANYGLFTASHKFQVIEVDKRIVIYVTALPPEAKLRLKLYRPDCLPLILTEATNIDGIVCSIRGGYLQFNIIGNQDNTGWAGEWELQIEQSDYFLSAKFYVWAFSSLSLKTSLPLPSTRMESTDRQMCFDLYNHSGITFSQLSCRENIIESVTKYGARIVELLIEAAGMDKQGHTFARRLYTNLVSLEARSAWRQRLAREINLIFVPATIVECERSIDGAIIRLRLMNDKEQRDVLVSSPLIRHRLAMINVEEGSYYFGIAGNELLAIVERPVDS
ncbi:MAG: hypothetical protein AB1489_23820, partial [Acidobacteriota bacterium]